MAAIAAGGDVAADAAQNRRYEQSDNGRERKPDDQPNREPRPYRHCRHHNGIAGCGLLPALVLNALMSFSFAARSRYIP
jgi:hypothetical protein